MRSLAVLLAFPLVAALPSLFGTEQSAGVTGKLNCNGAPASNIKVKLYDVDTTDLDDLMAEGVTDSEGRFTLKGKEKELTTIDPKLNIYHRCGHDKALCTKKFSIEIPKSFVTQGPVPDKIFDIGEINLNGKFSGQSTDCIN